MDANALIGLQRTHQPADRAARWVTFPENVFGRNDLHDRR